MSEAVLRPAAFIDRDGVINEERRYVNRLEDFVLLPGAVPGLRKLQGMGFELVVVTNQAGVARGYYGEGQVHKLHAHMHEMLAGEGVHLRAVMYCPHHPQGSVAAYALECTCRKPAPGLLLQAAAEHGLDLKRSVLVGDKVSDLEAGFAAGLQRCVLVESGHSTDEAARRRASRVCADLLAAADWMEGAPA